MKKIIFISLLACCKALSAQMWNDTAASYFLTVQYRPLDYYYKLWGADLGIYYYNPAHDLHFSLKGGGGSYNTSTSYTTGESHSVFLKPGVFIVQDRQAKRIQTVFGMNISYMYERQHLESVHVDPIWGDLKRNYITNTHKFGVGAELTFFIKITHKLQGLISLQATVNVFDSPNINILQYWSIDRYQRNPNFNTALGLAYKLNK